MKKSVAVIGQGFVGGSLTTVLSERGVTTYVYDKMGKVVKGGIQASCVIRGKIHRQPASSVSDLITCCESIPGQLETFSMVYFVCLPTPMFDDGECDISIVEGVLDELAAYPSDQSHWTAIGTKRIAVVKSTIPPGTTERWNKKYKGTNLRIMFNPEFLREATALDDMRNQDRIVLGGPRPWINRVKEVFQSAFPNVPIIKTSSTTAEMVKYFTNNFLTVKVAFANEMFQICEALDASGLDIDYDKVIEYSKYDPRIGDSHLAVPGPDGHKGYGGSCFVKDINAMIHIAKILNVQTQILTGAWQKNLEVRPEKDWELLVGRAVSDKNRKH